MPTYRFYFHYNKHTKRMSVHFRGKCYDVTGSLFCTVPSVSKINKRQPFVVMRGQAGSLLATKSGDIYILP